jgi:hypothetical protein
MARRPTIVAAKPVGPQFDGSTPAALVAVEHQVNIDREKLDIEVRELATRIGYQLPAHETNADLIQRDIAANMRRSVEACLEVGRGLTILRKVCVHGEFMTRLEALGINDRVARRFMQASVKFSHRTTSTDLQRLIGSESKLFELLVLDDEQLDELVLTGQTGELALDDVASMSVKELRAAVRDAREKIEALDEVAADDQKTIRKLKEKLSREKPTPTFLAKEVLDNLARESVSCVAHITAGLRSVMSDALDFDRSGDDSYQHLATQACTSALENVAAALRSLAADFGITPGSTSADGVLDESMAHAISQFEHN